MLPIVGLLVGGITGMLVGLLVGGGTGVLVGLVVSGELDGTVGPAMFQYVEATLKNINILTSPEVGDVV